MRPAHIKKSPEELRQDFKRNFGFLTRSLEAYKGGVQDEAIRLAGSVYVFVHDHGKSSVSILSHVNRKNIPFHNTGVPLNPRNLLTENPLVMFRLGGVGASVAIPRYNDGHTQLPPLPFSKWWEAPVLRDNKRREFSRKNLIMTVRNKQGSGHVSADLDEAFSDLNNRNSMGWVTVTNGHSQPLAGIEYATVAQIAHELRVTLELHCADLLQA